MGSVSIDSSNTGQIRIRRQYVTRAACREKVPRLQDPAVTLREVSPLDAQSLAQHLAEDQVAEYLARGPATAAGFEEFARWARAQRAAGTYICFAVIPAGRSEAVGIIQIWPIEANWSIAEWGFAVGREYWGSELFDHAVT